MSYSTSYPSAFNSMQYNVGSSLFFRASFSSKIAPHSILYGPPAQAKELVKCLSHMMGVHFVVADKSWKESRILSELMSLPTTGYTKVGLRGTEGKRFLIFLDECHYITEEALRVWEVAMKDREVTIKGDISWIPEFTFVGATTDPSLLPANFLQQINLHIDPVLLAELFRIMNGCIEASSPRPEASLLRKLIGQEQAKTHELEYAVAHQLECTKKALTPRSASVTLPSHEVCYWDQDVTYTKMTGKRTRATSGKLIVTDAKIRFVSPEGGFEVPYSKVVAVAGNRGKLDLQLTSSQGNGTYWGFSTEIVAEIIRTLMLRTHRSTESSTQTNPRHIPQEIKNIVWQRDRGACVECNAKEYLEFDHIIPFSRGGANSVNNVQLLCRKCNGTKSDKI